MPARVSPTERIRAEIDQLLGADQDLGETLEEVVRLGARLLLQAALEAEVTTFLAVIVTPAVTVTAPGIATATPR